MASPGGSARRILAGVLEMARARVELAGVELEQERLRLEQMVLATALALFAGCAGVMLLAAWLVFVAEPAQRAWVLGGLVCLFFAAALLLVARVRRLAARGTLFQSTRAELAKDAAALRGGE